MQQKRELPAPTAVFCDKKAGILRQLALPEAEYSDASPKGSVDAGIRHLIDEVNRAEGFVTTSSCAGRVSVFLEGRRGKTAAALDEGGERQRGQRAGVGGKGAGGTWLFVSHEPVPRDPQHGCVGWLDALGFSESAVGQGSSHVGEEPRLIHFKFEPMVSTVKLSSTHPKLTGPPSSRSSTSSPPPQPTPRPSSAPASKPASASREPSA